MTTRISQTILNHLSGNPMPEDAETIWLSLKAVDARISIGSVYKRLSKMADAGLVGKTHGDF